MKKLISVVIPVFNEERNVPLIFEALAQMTSQEVANAYDWEFVFVDDGSSDRSVVAVQSLAASDKRVSLIEFTRNFGKESATTAGLRAARGDAAVLIDADLHHPPAVILEFIKKWEAGGEVIMGVRRSNKERGYFKKSASRLFYLIMSKIGETKFAPQSTDFVLIDRIVIDEFNHFTEHNRITRGLLLWLGFRQVFVEFDAAARTEGEPGYSFSKLVHLAVHSFVQHSLLPLRIAGYLGLIITVFSGVFGVVMFTNQILLHGAVIPVYLSGTAFLATLCIFLSGLTLISIGLTALYIETIHNETANRPLYVVRKHK